jgi:ribosomal protein S28E/S33
VRQAGRIVSVAVIVAVRVNSDGRREISRAVHGPIAVIQKLSPSTDLFSEPAN